MTRRTFFKSSALMAALMPVLGWEIDTTEAIIELPPPAAPAPTGLDWIAYRITEKERLLERADDYGFIHGYARLAPEIAFEGIPDESQKIELGQDFSEGGVRFHVTQIERHGSHSRELRKVTAISFEQIPTASI